MNPHDDDDDDDDYDEEEANPTAASTKFTVRFFVVHDVVRLAGGFKFPQRAGWWLVL